MYTKCFIFFIFLEKNVIIKNESAAIASLY